MPRIRDAFAPLFAELPRLLSAAASERRRVDSQRADAGEGKRIQQLVEQAVNSMRSTISSRELEVLAERYARMTGGHQRLQLNRMVKAALGIDVFVADSRVPALVEGFVAENVALIKGIAQHVATEIEKSATRAVQDGTRYEDLASEFESLFGFPAVRARLIARDQVGKLYGQIGRSRNQELGVTSYIWHNSNDERVAGNPNGKYPKELPSHWAREGYVYAYDTPPEGGHPGQRVQCRCFEEPDFTGIVEAVNTNTDFTPVTEHPSIEEE